MKTIGLNGHSCHILSLTVSGSQGDRLVLFLTPSSHAAVGPQQARAFAVLHLFLAIGTHTQSGGSWSSGWLEGASSRLLTNSRRQRSMFDRDERQCRGQLLH